MPVRIEKRLKTAADTEVLGARLAAGLRAGSVIFLRGELGAGKTTLVRGLLHGLGHQGAVKSPTYTLIEPYFLPGHAIFHFDLYRLKHPEELEFLGLRDYLQAQGVCLIEWPERGEGFLPPADVDVFIYSIDDGRMARFEARSDEGKALLNGLE
ncbi:MAG TPA: tRNA (adenosine(37)-N6)-threonylcarbamoyltransferase complex ATPase subunit type 1 TsaE [Acidiferrobacterales bacterium]|nr:tRNA (adenosine(37)-N6)-threonylcarbamoyltransferase complex ATPase subunit type 1 TsaE [Acidiferrobacterales bacterium]